MRTPTATEQQSLELINRARMNPAGEFDAIVLNAATRTGVTPEITNALRYFNVDLALFQSQIASISPVAPVSWNSALATVATAHSQDMIALDMQSHLLPGEAGIMTRLQTAGYWNALTVSENVYAYAADAVYGHAGFFVDWGAGPGGMQSPAGHRGTILNAALTEVGIGIIAEANPATLVGPNVMTQDFGTRSNYAPQIVGVVINDSDGDAFYDIGEGLGNITVTARSVTGATTTTTTWASGGYQMALAPGSYSMTFSGGGFSGTVTKSVTIASHNVKIDAFADEAEISLVSRVMGDAASNTLVGTIGDDIMIGYRGADTLSGGAGNDRLLGEGEQAVFDPVAAQVYRLYQATLGRDPDFTGHMNWTNRLLSHTMSLPQAAAGFVASVEFHNRYGATTNTEFVTLLYNNVLHRSPDAGGLATWTGALDSGAQSRSEVVLGFSESREFVAMSVPDSLNYSWAGHQAEWADDVYRLYHATLDRNPDMAGLLNWTARLADGASFLNVVSGFVASTEFQLRYGVTTTTEFVTLLYNNVLDRAPDAGGLATWTRVLDSGAQSRAQVVQGFSQSVEFVTNTASDLVAYMRASAQDDRLHGGTGNNVLFGGIGADTFVFRAAAGGQQVVADLEAWDRIEMEGFGYAQAQTALAAMHQSGADVVFADQGVQITFLNTQLAQIDPGMIVLA